MGGLGTKKQRSLQKQRSHKSSTKTEHTKKQEANDNGFLGVSWKKSVHAQGTAVTRRTSLFRPPAAGVSTLSGPGGPISWVPVIRLTGTLVNRWSKSKFIAGGSWIRVSPSAPGTVTLSPANVIHLPSIGLARSANANTHFPRP